MKNRKPEVQLEKVNTCTSLGLDFGSTSKVFKSSVSDIEATSVTCQRTGKTDIFYRFLFPDWVNVIALTPDHRMVLVNQYRFGAGRVETEIPGGVINSEELPLDAGCRELLEETGYAGSNARIIGKVCPNPALQKNICYTVLVENVERIAEQMQDDMEDIKVFTLPIEEVFEMVQQGSMCHGLVLNALMFYRFSGS